MKRGRKKKAKKRLKRGLSTVLVALILILVSLAAVGIVWIVVRNLLQSETEHVSSGLGQFTLSLELQNVVLKSNGDINITVKRNAGAGDLTGINFIISDGVSSRAIKRDVTLKELDTNTFTITSSELNSSFGMAKDVSIVPIAGSDVVGSVLDSKEISNKDILKSLNVVSWWKLDGNANDEIGNNHGTLVGGIGFVDGKFGKAGSFDAGNYLQITNEANFDFTNNFTIEVWIKPRGSDTYNALITKFSGTASGWDWLLNVGAIRMTARGTSTIDTAGEGVDLRDGNWHHIVAVVTPSGIQQYEDGRALTPITGNWTATTNDAIPSIGYRSGVTNFNGTMDEIIIFNKSLTEPQVKSLYRLNLNSS